MTSVMGDVLLKSAAHYHFRINCCYNPVFARAEPKKGHYVQRAGQHRRKVKPADATPPVQPISLCTPTKNNR